MLLRSEASSKSNSVVENVIKRARALAPSLMHGMAERVGVHCSPTAHCGAGHYAMHAGSLTDSCQQNQ